MTEVFKCKKFGTKCCAPKTLIKEALGQKEEEPNYPKITTLKPTSSVAYTTPWQLFNATPSISNQRYFLCLFKYFYRN